MAELLTAIPGNIYNTYKEGDKYGKGMETEKKILFKSFGGEIPVHAECVDRNNKFAGDNEPAQRHRAFYERPPRRVRSIYSDTQQLFRGYQGKGKYAF